LLQLPKVQTKTASASKSYSIPSQTQGEEHMTAADYCKKCNAPHAPAINVFARCGGCAVINGKLPPTKFIEAKLKEKNT